MLCQVLLQPFPLRRRFLTASDLSAFAIQRNDVPRAEIVTVICLCWITRDRSPVACIAGRSAVMVFVISRGWTCAIFEASPGRPVAVRELLIAPIGISQITGGENCSGNFF